LTAFRDARLRAYFSPETEASPSRGGAEQRNRFAGSLLAAPGIFSQPFGNTFG